MAEKEQIVNTESENNKPSVLSKVGAGFKEWGRKQVVTLKRRPQNIAFIFLFIVTVFNLLSLTIYSELIVSYGEDIEWVGLMVFVNTLLSILVLVAYLNTFPKIKGVNSKVVFTMTESGVKLHINVLMLAVTLLMIIVMMVCEIFYYILMNQGYYDFYLSTGTEINPKVVNLFESTFTLTIVHIILLGISALLILTLPLYRKLLMKINTSINLESATENMQKIDLED